MKSKNRKWIIIGGSILGFFMCACIGLIILGKWAGSDPKVQATTTARSVARMTGTAIAMVNATGSAIPTSTTSQTARPTNTIIPSKTPTETIDPLFTPPTSTSTATNTPTATASNTPTITPSPTKTSTPTKTPTATIGPTPIPTDAGMSTWIIHDSTYVGVRDLSWDKYLGYFRAEEGKIFVSVYIVVINMGDTEKSVLESDFSLIDGGGQITSGVFFAEKEPKFSGCTLTPGGSCEGWWTTMIVDNPQVRGNLTLRWDPCLLFCDAMDVYIRQ